MEVYKFGGASVKDSPGLKNLGEIVLKRKSNKLIVVVSAMAKTTNALEEVLFSWQDGDVKNALDKIETIKLAHHKIVRESFPGLSSESVLNQVNDFFLKLAALVKLSPSENKSYNYDKVVSFGELVSTHIVYQYLLSLKLSCAWVDAGDLIRSDNNYRNAKIDWDKTRDNCQKYLTKSKADIIITQGFIAKTAEGQRTTLGREGSDFTGAILAYSVDAESLTIWKDVPGLLNADPRKFPDTVKLDEISYREALELSYYGASVIHPKTVKPLQNKSIPLYIKPFGDCTASGSKVYHADHYDADVPSYIVKEKQILISISPRDFSFMVEEHLMGVFAAFAKHGITMNLMQNSAISFSAVVDDSQQLKDLVEHLKGDFQVLYNREVSLVTIRHYNEDIIKRLTNGKNVLVEQKTRQTARFVCAS